jgi:hypothetical protein
MARSARIQHSGGRPVEVVAGPPRTTEQQGRLVQLLVVGLERYLVGVTSDGPVEPVAAGLRPLPTTRWTDAR